MLNRTLVIGLGGSAEKLVRYLNRDVERRLRAAGWERRSVEAWRWLCIDVAKRSDPIADAAPRTLGDTGERVALVTDAAIEYATYFDELTDRPETLPALLGSLADPDTPLPPPADGAGQRPQVGNAVAARELGRIADAIERHAQTLETNAAQDELKEAARALGAREIDDPGVNLFVVSSLCGGSGAGLLQLVLELLQGTATMGQEWRRTELTTVLLTPDVFDTLPPHQRTGVNANALHTVSALLNGCEAIGPAPAELMQLLKIGNATRLRGRRAAVTNFFVGSSNHLIGYKHTDAVLEATAKAIGRIITDEDVTGHLALHLEANRDGAPVKADFRIVDPTETSRPASSLGYASVSVDRGLLADYATERIARAQLEQLQHGHRAERTTEAERDETTIPRLTRAYLPQFLAAAGLDEQAAIATLYGEHPQLRPVLGTELEKILQRIATGDSTRPAQRWDAILERDFDALTAEVERTQQTVRAEAAAHWSERTARLAQGAVAHRLGRSGFPVTLRLLEAAQESLGQTAAEFERACHDELEPAVDRQLRRARRQLARDGSRMLRNDHEDIMSAARLRMDALKLKISAAHQALVAQLLREASDALVAPLHAAVERAWTELKGSVERYDREVVERWTPGPVPRRLRPADNELLLEPVDDAPQRFELLLTRMFATNGAGDALRKAAAEAIAGGWPAGADERPTEQTLIRAERSWIGGGAASSRAAFLFPLDARLLEARARAWVEQRHGALRERVALSIADWVRKGDPGRDEILADRVVSAIACAEPLAKIDSAVYQRVHGGSAAPPSLSLSTLPLARAGRAGERVHAVLRAAEMSDGAIDALFDETSPARTIEISGFMAQPVHPVVLSGLFVPIHRDWQTRTDAAMRRQFESFRRTRPLTLFVPLSLERQRHFVAGWLVAEQLGQLVDLAQPWSAQPLSVWTPRGWRAFPPHLLGGDPEGTYDTAEVLPRVLLSLPLALASYASQQLGELEAYMRILDLGRPGSDELHAWIEGAPPETPPGTEAMPVPQTPIEATWETPEHRRAWVLHGIGDVGVRWQEWLDERPLTPDDTWRAQLRRELGPLVLDAVEALRAGLTEATPAVMR